MNVYMNFILQLHRLENEFKEDDAINDVKKAVYNAVENFSHMLTTNSSVVHFQGLCKA